MHHITPWPTSPLKTVLDPRTSPADWWQACRSRRVKLSGALVSCFLSPLRCELQACMIISFDWPYVCLLQSLFRIFLSSYEQVPQKELGLESRNHSRNTWQRREHLWYLSRSYRQGNTVGLADESRATAVVGGCINPFFQPHEVPTTVLDVPNPYHLQL